MHCFWWTEVGWAVMHDGEDVEVHFTPAFSLTPDEFTMKQSV
jgi:hypothetical protein